METARLYFAVAFCTIAVALTACGGSALVNGGIVNTTSQRGDRSGATRASWMAPDAAQVKELFYSSDPDSGSVSIFDYQTGKPEGKLGNFAHAVGQCVSANGNVFIADQGFDQVREYAHGRIRPIKTFNAQGWPVGCSVSPNGDFAVGNGHLPSQQGDVVVFKDAKGQGRAYSNRNCYEVEYVAYDGKGNLYVLAENSHLSQVICELPRNSMTMKLVKSKLKLKNPLGAMWDGKHIAIADTYYGLSADMVIYQTKEDANGGLIKVGRTLLNSDACYYAAAIQNPFIVGSKNTPDNHQLATEVAGVSGLCLKKVSVWHYPAGGHSYRSFRRKEQGQPRAQSVSIAE